MTVTQRTQYLFGRSVVELASPQRAGAFSIPAAGSHGDVRQAEYYQEQLVDLRTALIDEVAHHRAALTARESGGDTSGVRRSQRAIRVKETELAEIDGLIAALNSRFPTSRISR